MTLGLAPPGRAWSQTEPAPTSPIALGSRVRVVAPLVVEGRIQGTVLRLDQTSLLIGVEDAAPIVVPHRAITQIEVATGKKRRTLKGLLIGAGVGTVALAITAGVSCPSDCDSGWGEVLAAGALGGALYGAGIGALIKTDRWSVVPAGQLRVSLAPVRGRGIGVTVALGF